MSKNEATLCRMTASHWKEDQMMPTYFVSQKARKGYYRDLKEALQHVPPYCRIEISGGGVFHERIVVDKPVEICVAKASDPPVLVYKTTPLVLQTDEAYIEGITIEVETNVPSVSVTRGSPVLKWCQLQGLEVSGNASPTVQESKITDGKTHGLYLLDHASGTYTKNTIYGHTGYSILMEAVGSATMFSYNTISESKQGQLCVKGGDADGTIAPTFLLNRFSDDLSTVSANGSKEPAGVLPAYKLEALPVKEQGMQVKLMPVDVGADVGGVGEDDAADDPLVNGSSTKCAVLVAGARARPTFTRNSLTSCQMHGFYLRGGCGGEYDSNYASNNKGWGFLIEGERTSAKLTNNQVSNNGGGIRVVGSPVHISVNNVFVGNRGIQLYVQNCHADFVCERNVVRAAVKVGVWCTGAGAGHFRLNEFESCAFGMRIEAGATPLVEACSFDACSVGVYALAEGQGELRECTFSDMSVAGAVIATQANPTFARCSFSASSYGIKVLSEGRGVVEACVIKEFRSNGIEVLDGGDPLVRLSEIRKGYDDGVFVTRGGRGRFESNLIVGCAGAQMRVSDGGSPTLIKNVIGHSSDYGIIIDDGGRGDLSGNIVRCCYSAGVLVSGDVSAPRVVGNYIYNCGSYGLHITGGINGTYEENVLAGCGRANVNIAGKALGITGGAGAASGGVGAVSQKKPSVDPGRASTRAASTASRATTSAAAAAAAAVPTRTALLLKGNVIRGSLWCGVTVERQAKVLMTGNTIADCAQAVTVRGASRVLIVSNDVSRCGHGVCADEEVFADVLGNYFYGITHSAVCSLSTQRCQVQWNSFHLCGTALLLRRVLAGSCCENDIRSSRSYGIFLGIDCRAKVFRNVLYDNRVGICFGELNGRAEVFDNAVFNSYMDGIRVSGERLEAVNCYGNLVCSSHTGVLLRAGNARLRFNLVINCLTGIRVSNNTAESGVDFSATGTFGRGAFSLNSTRKVLPGAASGRSTTKAAAKNNKAASKTSPAAAAAGAAAAGAGADATPAAAAPAAPAAPVCASVVQYSFVSCCGTGGTATLACTASVTDSLLCSNDIGFRFTGKDAAAALKGCVVCNSSAIGVLSSGGAAGSVSGSVLFKNYINAVALDDCTTSWSGTVLEAPVVFNCLASGEGARPHFSSCLLSSRAAATRDVAGSSNRGEFFENAAALDEQLQGIIAVATKGAAAAGRGAAAAAGGANTAPQRSVLFKINDAIAEDDMYNSGRGNGGGGGKRRLVAALSDEERARVTALPSLWDDVYAEPRSWRERSSAVDYTALADEMGVLPVLPGMAGSASSPTSAAEAAAAAAAMTPHSKVLPVAGGMGAAVAKRAQELDEAPFPYNRRRSAILWPVNMMEDGVLGGPGGPFLLHRTVTAAAASAGGQRHNSDDGDLAPRHAQARAGFAYVCSGVWLEHQADPVFERSYLGEHVYMGRSGDRRLGPDGDEEWIADPLDLALQPAVAAARGGSSKGNKKGSSRLGGSQSAGVSALDAAALQTGDEGGRLYKPPLSAVVLGPPGAAAESMLGQLLKVGSTSVWRQNSTGAHFFYQCCPLLASSPEPETLRIKRAARRSAAGKETEVDPALVGMHISSGITEHIAGYAVLATDSAVGQFVNCVFGRNARGARLGSQARTVFRGCRFEGHTGNALEYLEGAVGTVSNCTFKDSRFHQILVRNPLTAPTIDGNTFAESPFSAIICTLSSSPTITGNRIRLIHTNAIVVDTAAAPVLERNTVEACTCGLLIKGGGRGRIARNTIKDSTDFAIHVHDADTAPEIAENSIVGSRSVGVCVSGAGASPFMWENVLSDNVVGIALRTGAGGVYASNRLRRHETGILIEESSGECQQNRVLESSVVGIKVTGAHSSPALADNVISNGAAVGLHMINCAGAVLRNRIASNQGDGCVVEGALARPRLMANQFSGNAAAGARLCLECKPALCANVFMRNGGRGLVVTGANTAPAMEGDVFKGNQTAGAIFTNKSGGTVNGAVLSTTAGGPALLVSGEASPTLQECVFIENDAGGLVVAKDAGTCLTTRCLFAGNTTAPAYTHAGRDSGSRVVACVFVENHTSLLCESEGRVEMVGCAFLGPHASGAALRSQREASPSLTHCFFAGMRCGLFDQGIGRYNRCVFIDCQLGAEAAGSASFYECELRDCATGIRASRGMAPLMCCLFAGCGKAGVHVTDEGQPAISESGILRCGRGVLADGNGGGSVTGSRIIWNNDNVVVADSASLEVSGNLIYDASNIGVHLKAGRPEVVGNEIFDNYYAGVLVEAVTGGKLEDNRISFAREDGCLVFRDAASKKEISVGANTLHNSYSPPPNTQFKHTNERQQMYKKVENEKERNAPTVVEQRKFLEETALLTLLRASRLAAHSVAGAAEDKEWLADDGVVPRATGGPGAKNKGEPAPAAAAAQGNADAEAGAEAPHGEATESTAAAAAPKEPETDDPRDAAQRAADRRAAIEGNTDEPLQARWDRLPPEAARAASSVYTPHRVALADLHRLRQSARNGDAAHDPMPSPAPLGNSELRSPKPVSPEPGEADPGSPFADDAPDDGSGESPPPGTPRPTALSALTTELAEGLPTPVPFVLFNRTKRRVLAALEALQCPAGNPTGVTYETILNRAPLAGVASFVAASDDATLRGPQRDFLANIDDGSPRHLAGAATTPQQQQQQKQKPQSPQPGAAKRSGSVGRSGSVASRRSSVGRRRSSTAAAAGTKKTKKAPSGGKRKAMRATS